MDPVNSSNAYALGTSGVFHRSSNGGVNWQAIGGPPNTVPIGLPNPYQPPPSGVASITIDPQNPATLYVWCDFSVYRSTDGAQSWQPLSTSVVNGQASAFALAPSQPNVLYVVN